MKTVRDIYRFIDNLAPFSTAMDFDNCGLQVGSFDRPVSKVLLALDVTHDVVKEAKKSAVDLIISHHPVIFKPLRRILSDSVEYSLVRAGIDLISAHTNLDMAEGGVNTCLAQRLTLSNTAPLSIYSSQNYEKIVVFVPRDFADAVRDAMTTHGAGVLGEYSRCSFSCSGVGAFCPSDAANPFCGQNGEFETFEEEKIEMICAPDKTQQVIAAMRKVHPYETPAFDIFETKAVKRDVSCGLIGDLPSKMSPDEFAVFVKQRLKCKGIRYTRGENPVKRVAVCSGAGGMQLDDAIRCQADAFVTGEVKHHELLRAQSAGITLVDAGHYNTEDVVIAPLAEKLAQNFPQVQFFKSLALKNPTLHI